MSRRERGLRGIVGAELLVLAAILGFWAWRQSLGGLLWRLSHDRADQRSDVLDEIGRRGPDASEAIPALLEAMASPDDGTQVSAAAALRNVGGASGLAAAAKHPNETVRWRAVEAVGKDLAPQIIIPALRGALRDDSPLVRRTAAEILGELGPAASSAIPDLAAALRDADARVRIQAVVSLGEMSATAPLAEALADPERSVRLVTVQGLSRLGLAGLELLCLALRDADAEVAGGAADAIGALGPPAAPALPALTKALEQASPSVRAHVAQALARVAPDDARRRRPN